MYSIIGNETFEPCMDRRASARITQATGAGPVMFGVVAPPTGLERRGNVEFTEFYRATWRNLGLVPRITPCVILDDFESDA